MTHPTPPGNRRNPLVPPDDLPDTIPEAFRALAAVASDRIAMQIKEGSEYRRYTYGEMLEQVQGLSSSLIALNLRPADRAAIVMENRPEWAIAYLGIVAAGGTAVPLDIQMSPEDLRSFLETSGSRFVFASERTRPFIGNLPSGITLINVDADKTSRELFFIDLVTQGLSNDPARVQVDPDNVASLLYTSGTTKRPKGVVLTHRNLMANAKAVIGTKLPLPDDNFLVILPLHHVYPFMIAFLVPLLLGARMTFLQSLKGPDLLQCIRETQVTMLVGVPQVFAMIRRAIFDELNRRGALVRVLFSTLLLISGAVRNFTGWNLGRVLFAQIHRRFGESLRLLCSGGAKLDPQVNKDLTRLGFTIREGYGLTETSPVVAFSPLARPKRGSVGLPISQVEVRIVSPDDKGIGEVTVRGPNVMKGYDADPEATGQAIRDGWFYTGDLGYLDGDGYLFLTGRIKEVIVTAGGKNILPEELEVHYQRSPAIAEVCILGMERAGEEGEHLHAVVVPDFEYLKSRKVHDMPGYVNDEITKIALTLASYQRLTGVTLRRDPLPRTRLGKIQRHLVAAAARSGEPPRKQTPALTPADEELLNTKLARDVLAALTALVPERKDVSLDDHLDLDLGLDSLKRIELLAALENQFGPLPETLAGEVITTRDLIERLTDLDQSQGAGEAGSRTWKEILESPAPPGMMNALLAAPGGFDRVATQVGFSVLDKIFHAAFKLTVKGQEHIPTQGPLLLAANHLSFLDPFLLLVAVPRSIRDNLFSLGWEAHFRSPIVAWVARFGHVIAVGPSLPLVMALRASAEVLKQGRSLLIFPEGERSIDGRLLPFKKGIGVLACELGIPVIPTRIEGSFEAWPPEARWPRFSQISVQFAKSMTVTPSMITGWIEQGEDPHQAATKAIREALSS